MYVSKDGYAKPVTQTHVTNQITRNTLKKAVKCICVSSVFTLHITVTGTNNMQKCVQLLSVRYVRRCQRL